MARDISKAERYVHMRRDDRERGICTEKTHSSMGEKRRDEWLAVLRVMWRGQKSNYGTTKDRYRTGRGSEEERETEKMKKRNRVGGCGDLLESLSRHDS